MTDLHFPGITILGLGPGGSNLLTVQAKDWIDNLDEIYLRTKEHPVVADLPADLRIHSFDDLYEQLSSFEEVYAEIVARVIELGKQPQGITYAVPGHPLVAEATTPEILRRAYEEKIPVQLIEGLSFLEPVFSMLHLDPFPQLTLMDALELGTRYYPPHPPSSPLLIAQIYSRLIASEVKISLGSVYPDDHPVSLVHDAGTPHCKLEPLLLYEIDRQENIGLRSVLFVPPLGEEASFEGFQELIARLRAPDGCPWDREQTHNSLKRHLLEETYELLDALDREDPLRIAEELGDLLLQIVLHAQIGLEDGEFSMYDILSGIHHKIVRRHPHVFADTIVEGSGGVVAAWEQIKARERKENSVENRSVGMLEGVPLALPALTQAQAIQERAARIGFDWDEISPVYEKVEEEYHEVRQAAGTEAIEAEIGDLLFAAVNLARWLHVDAETALRVTSVRFKRRFHHIEARAADSGKKLEEMSLAEMDAFWDEAKREEG